MVDKLRGLIKSKNKKRQQMIDAIVLSSIIFIIAHSFSKIVFFINDDTNILYTLSGNYTGEPTDHPFINVILSYTLIGLYKMLPQVPWYPIAQMVGIYVSITVFIYYCIKAGDKGDVPRIITIVAFTLIYLCFFYSSAVMLQFTTTSALLGSAGILIALHIDSSLEPKKYMFSIFLSGLFLLASCLFRKNLIPYYFAIWILTLARNLLVSLPIERKKYIIAYMQSALVIVLLIVGAVFANSAIRSTEDWIEYKNFDTARYKMQDYPHDYASDNPELYESIGWTKGLNDLTGEETWSYFMMDSRVNIEAFNTISNTSNATKNLSINIADNLTALWNQGILPKMCILYSVVVGTLAIVVFFVYKNKAVRIVGLSIMGYTILFLAGFIYLSYIQRVPFRALQSICFPMVMTCTTLTLSLYRYLKERIRKVAMILVLVSIFLLSICGYKCVVESNYLVADRYNKSQNFLIAEKYALEHPDEFFVYDTSLTFRYLPFVNYGSDKPTNIMYWGGMGWKSPAYYDQLRKNRIDELYSDVLLNENAYFITNPNYSIHGEKVFDIFKRYMEETYPGVQTELVDKLDRDITVYKFVLEER